MRVISGEFGGRPIRTASGLPGYRPATDKVRQAVFSMLEAREVDWPRVRAIDMFAGSGSLGLEALSRGAAEVWFVEKSPGAVRVIERNLRELGVSGERCKVLRRDVLALLKRGPGTPFDLAFVDPPYGRQLARPCLERALANSWLDKGALLVAEIESDCGFDPAGLEGATLLVNRTYGQTRICIWIAKDRK
jgi:16S rRNA (guanine966-N2)-methyltransferase